MSPKDDINNSSTQSVTVDLIFKVWAPNLNRYTHQLFLLGSLKSMGAWNIKDAVKAQPTPDAHIWKVEIRGIPVKSSFEWSWVRAAPDRKDVRWERMTKRNSGVDTFGGVIHTIYGDGEEVFIQSVTCAEISTYRKVKDGQVLVLSGSSSTTGLWDLKKAVKAVESPRQSGYWSAQIAFDANTILHFKWAIVREKDRNLHVMETESHSLFGRRAWLRVVAPWNVPRIFTVDTPISLEPLDQVKGRTDVLVTTKKMRSDAIRKWLKLDPDINTPDLCPITQVPNVKAPPQTQATPTKTNQEKAQQAFVALASNQMTSPFHFPSSSRTPTVQPLDNVDDHVKKRSDALGRTDKQMKHKGQDEQHASGPIKGRGQTLVAKNSGHEKTTNDESSGVDLYESCLEYFHLMDSSYQRDTETTKLARQLVHSPNDQGPNMHRMKEKVLLDLIKDENGGDSGFETNSQETKASDQTFDSVSTSTSQSQTDESDTEEEVVRCSDKNRFREIPWPYDIGFLEGCWDVSTQRAQDLKFGISLQYNNSLFEKDDDYFDLISSKVFQADGKSNPFHMETQMEDTYLSSIGKRSEKPVYSRPLIGCSGFKGRMKEPLTHTNQDTGDMISDLEYPDMTNKRQIARILEEQWGASSGDNANVPNRMLDRCRLPSDIVFAPSPSCVSFHAGGNGDLTCSSKSVPRVAQYSYTDLADTITPKTDNIDHRAVARYLERQWGLESLKTWSTSSCLDQVNDSRNLFPESLKQEPTTGGFEQANCKRNPFAESLETGWEQKQTTSCPSNSCMDQSIKSRNPFLAALEQKPLKSLAPTVNPDRINCLTNPFSRSMGVQKENGDSVASRPDTTSRSGRLGNEGNPFLKPNGKDFIG